MFSRPTVFRGALWLPYRRELGTIQAAVKAAVSGAGAVAAVSEGSHATSAGAGGVVAGRSLSVVFAHADVVRSHMDCGVGL